MVDEVRKDIVYEALDDRWGVGQAEGHHKIIKVPKGDVKSSLPLISLSYPDQVLGIVQI